MFFKRWGIGWLWLLWLCMQVALYVYLGEVKVMGDSQVYLLAAKQLKTAPLAEAGIFSKWLLYMSYILLLTLAELLYLPLETVIGVQLLISVVALTAFFKSALLLTDSRKAAFLIACFFICFWKLQQWNFYLLTESLFINLGVIWFWLLLQYRAAPRKLLFCLPLLLVLLFLRPIGVTVLLATLAYFVSGNQLKRACKKRPVVASMVGMTCLLVLLVVANLVVVRFGPLVQYMRGTLVFGIAELKLQSTYPSLVVENEALVVPPDSYLPLLQLVYFIGANPWFFLKLSLGKLLYFFGHIKPFYSAAHNLFIGLTLYPLYILAAIGGYKFSPKPALRYIITFSCLQALIVALTIEDWDGRFLMPVLPFIMLLAAAGLQQLLPKSDP